MEKYLIKGGLVVDGSGAKPEVQDVLIENGFISAVGNDLHAEHAKNIDASGKIVCPGFIDIHRHADTAVFNDDFGELELHQGITTIVSGNCGFGISPCNPENAHLLNSYIKPILGDTSRHYDLFSEYIYALEKIRTKINFAVLVGNGTVRIAVNGFRKGRLSKLQLNRSKWYINEAMEAGALGLSMGLMYSPEQYYTGEELVSLCKTIGKRGLISTHIRGSGNNLIPSIEEVISIAKKAEVSLEISHLKASGKNNWNESIKRTKAIIDQARSQGLDVHCDVYPYTAGASSLMALMPPILSEGGIEESIKRLKDSTWKKKISQEFEKKHDAWDNLAMSVGWENVVISSVQSDQYKWVVGKSINEIAAALGKDDINCVFDLLIHEEGNVGMIIFSMSDEDVSEIISWDYSMIISDSLYVSKGLPHPRLYGSFPRIISKYVISDKILPIEDAIRKMSSLPAKKFKIKNKGELRVGYDADIVIFDLENFKDNATFTEPKKFASGIDYVFLGGEVALMHDEITNTNNGGLIKNSIV